MRYNLQLIFGGIIIFIGLSLILAVLFDINLWGICFSLGLILLGVWILLRPKILPKGTDFRLLLFGDYRRKGDWQVSGEEIWMFVGDIKLDMTETVIPTGETVFRVVAFIGDIDLTLPPEVGVSINSMAFISDTRIMRRKREAFVVPVEYQSEGYESAERKVRLESLCFIADIDIDQLQKASEPPVDTTENTE